MIGELTIVMYHYVREPGRSRYPGIKGRLTGEFRAQVTRFEREYVPVTMAEVVHCIRTGDALPPRAVLLTFDDGYVDHYTTCFPILHDAGIHGAFFPTVAPCRDGMLLNVNRVHFILASAGAGDVGAQIDEAILANDLGEALLTPADYRAKWASANRFDDAETIYVKRMLQVALPAATRDAVARNLFARHVASDERAFASELYCTPEQLRLMQASGMYVGSHGVSHSWLNMLDAGVQRSEIEGSLEFLRSIGSPVDEYWAMCYPYGAWNPELLAMLRGYNCSVGLTTEVAVARIGVHDALTLPRLDTNDLPVAGT